MKLAISIPIHFHIFLMKLKLKPLYPDQFERLQLQTASLISSNVGLLSNQYASSLLIFGSKSIGRLVFGTSRWVHKDLKNLLASFFMALGPFILLSPTFKDSIFFLHFLPLAIARKYLVFLSLNFIEFSQANCLQ